MTTLATTPTNEIFKGELLANTANMLKDAGMKIYYTPGNNNAKTTYFFFVEGDNIGYCQEGYFGGIRFSTVHKPCKECGTGYGLTDDPGLFEPTIKDAKQAFISAPNWATSNDRQAVRKYKNWEDYMNCPINQILEKIEY